MLCDFLEKWLFVKFQGLQGGFESCKELYLLIKAKRLIMICLFCTTHSFFPGSQHRGQNVNTMESWRESHLIPSFLQRRKQGGERLGHPSPASAGCNCDQPRLRDLSTGFNYKKEIAEENKNLEEARLSPGTWSSVKPCSGGKLRGRVGGGLLRAAAQVAAGWGLQQEAGEVDDLETLKNKGPYSFQDFAVRVVTPVSLEILVT